MAKSIHLHRDTIWAAINELVTRGLIKKTPRKGCTTILTVVAMEYWPAVTQPSKPVGASDTQPSKPGAPQRKLRADHPAENKGHKGNPLKDIPQRASTRLLASRNGAIQELVKTVLIGKSPSRPNEENDLMATCKRLIGVEEMAENGGIWRNRARQDADKLGRCLDELQRALREGETVVNRAAYLTDLFGRFQ